MSALACPFRPVKQKERAELHMHQYPLEAQMLLSNGTWLQDCTCGHRRRVQKDEHNNVIHEYEDGLLEGAGSLANSVYFEETMQSRQFIDRWS